MLIELVDGQNDLVQSYSLEYNMIDKIKLIFIVIFGLSYEFCQNDLSYLYLCLSLYVKCNFQGYILFIYF